MPENTTSILPLTYSVLHISYMYDIYICTFKMCVCAYIQNIIQMYTYTLIHSWERINRQNK